MPKATDHDPRPITKAAFSRAVGRSKSAISEALRGPLKDALMRSGRVDAAHPAAVAYARRCGVGEVAVPAPARPANERFDEPANVDELLDLTYRQITDKFGSNQGFADFVSVRKVIADTRRLELKNEAADGTSISRELVRQNIFGLLDGCFRRLLGDSAKTIARRVYAIGKGSGSIEEAERLVVDMISSQLKRVKETAIRVLRGDPEQPQPEATAKKAP
jgi:hypothetical protein